MLKHRAAFNRRTFLKQMVVGTGGWGLVTGLPGLAWAKDVSIGELPRSSPEAQGVSSQGILGFLEAVSKSKHEFHSFMLVRHGHVIAEGWWSPYRADLNHTLYSLSKSFTSTAVGLAVGEGRLTVDDTVVSFFPDDLPAQVSANLAALRVKHLLTMSVGHAQDSTGALWKEQNWVRAFLALPIPNQPGSAFLYNSGATYMLSAIVQKVTGQKLIDYLGPRLFQPLDITGMTWEACPRGINTGGWGLSIPTEGIAKFAQLYLQQGRWKDRRPLSPKWIAEATSFKIQQPGTDLDRLKQTSDWHQGYCYQFWRCRHNAFRGDGAFGQFAVVMPDRDAVLAITSESPSMQGELDLVWDHLLPAMSESPLPRDGVMEETLRRKLSTLALWPPRENARSAVVSRASGKPIRLESNSLNLERVTFDFRDDACVFSARDPRAEHTVRCGIQHWQMGETTMPGTPPMLTSGPVTGPSKVAASGTWKDAETFEMTWRYCETPHHDVVNCRFEGDRVTVKFMNSITLISPSHPEKRPVLQGRLMA